MDLDEAVDEKAAERTAIHEKLFTFGLRSLKPVVAAVQGAALGGGTGLLANCHVVIAAQGAQFGLTELRLGMWPFVIHAAVVLALGERRTVELALTGRIFGTNDALQYGLVHEVTPVFELDDRATATAQHLANVSPATVRRGLDFVRQSRAMSTEEAVRLAAEMRAEVFRSADFAEGVKAFREKRKPVWPSLSKS
jgi:enoyl-CoA hydratase/carnithine racemase